jgi:hypothetical protein
MCRRGESGEVEMTEAHHLGILIFAEEIFPVGVDLEEPVEDPACYQPMVRDEFLGLL